MHGGRDDADAVRFQGIDGEDVAEREGEVLDYLLRFESCAVETPVHPALDPNAQWIEESRHGQRGPRHCQLRPGRQERGRSPLIPAGCPCRPPFESRRGPCRIPFGDLSQIRWLRCQLGAHDDKECTT